MVMKLYLMASLLKEKKLKIIKLNINYNLNIFNK